MSFESGVNAFADRFLSERTHRLIVEPALADLHFAEAAGRFSRAANRLAVIRAVAGGLRQDVSRASGGFVLLALLPAGYYLVLMTMFADFISLSASLFGASLAVLFLSLGPVVACFWPERRLPRVD